MKSINQKIKTRNFHIQTLLKNNKATLINQTSVYKEYYVLKQNALISNDYFDLVQIPNLRVYAGNLLKSIRLRLNLTQKEFSDRAGISKCALYQWEHNRAAMPLMILMKIGNQCGINKGRIYKLMRGRIIIFRKKVNLSFKYMDIFPLLPFISIMDKNKLVIKQTGKEYVNRILRLFKIKIYYSSNNQFVIQNLDLCNFLTTFFDRLSITKINPPLSNFFKGMKGIDLRKSVICPLLQTDGCGYLDKRKNLFVISFKNISKKLHNILVDSIYFAYHKFLPSSYLLKDTLSDKKFTECYVTRYVGKEFQPIYQDLIKICGNFKTSIYHSQDAKEYEQEAKPQLDYLLNAKLLEKIIALRIWASTEGAIIPMRRNKRGLIVPKLQISCTNKELLFKLNEVAESIGLHFTVRHEKNRGYKCLYNMAISCALSFLKIGGFINEVQVSKSSKYYEGINKQDLVYATLEHMIRERKDPSLRNLNMKEVHTSIRKIAENREFRKLNNYIRFFSQNDKVKKCLDY